MAHFDWVSITNRKLSLLVAIDYVCCVTLANHCERSNGFWFLLDRRSDSVRHSSRMELEFIFSRHLKLLIAADVVAVQKVCQLFAEGNLCTW